MKKFFLFLFVISPLFAVNQPSDVEAQTCSYWAAPSGSGSSGCTQGTPCTITRAWVVIAAAGAPGKTLCLTNGTYTAQDANGSVMQILLSGTNGNPLTIRAENDGAVTLDGQGVLQPIWIPNSNYVTIIGVNAHDSCGDVVSTAGGSNIIIRRVVAWDAGPAGTTYCKDGTNQHNVFGMNYAIDVLLEDVAAFGNSDGLIMMFGGAPNPKGTVRRAWGSFGGTYARNSPDEVVHAGYSSTNVTVENVIATWEDGAVSPDPSREFFIMGVDGREIKYLGSIGYLTGNPELEWGFLEQFDVQHQGPPFSGLIENVVIYMGTSSARPWNIANFYPCGSPTMPVCYFRNNTGVGSGYSNSIFGTNFSYANNLNVASLSSINTSANNIWNGTNPDGARVCKQYVNGTLTSTKLWPWPMDDRIKAALIQRYGPTGASSRLSGSAGSGYAANTVTSHMASLFGAIPAACLSGIVGTLAVTITVPATDPYPTPPALYQNNSIVFQGTAIP